MDRHKEAAQLLLSARRDPTQRLITLPDQLRPTRPEQAYLIQRSVMRELGEIRGWKVGSPSPAGGFTCAPIPARCVLDSPATIEGGDRGVEAEIAVGIATSLPAREEAYSPDDVLAALDSAHPAIEVLASRYVDVEAVDPMSNLADSLSSQALVLGPAILNWRSIDLAAEGVRVMVDGQEIKRRIGNPAGDMLRLLVWLANTGARWAGGLRAGQVVTTGSWTGKNVVPPDAEVRMAFDHCGDVSVRFGA